MVKTFATVSSMPKGIKAFLQPIDRCLIDEKMMVMNIRDMCIE